MSENYAIEGLMKTAMDSIKDMVDVNTIVGEKIIAPNNMMIIPISKVSFGFAAGGSEFNSGTINEYKRKDKEEQTNYKLPFGGGSGAGVNISPVAFVVVEENTVRVLPVEHLSSIDKLLDYVPELVNQIDKSSCKCKKTEKLEKIKNKKSENQNNFDDENDM